MREEIIGDARLILGDCREVLPELSGIDSVITDPPYGMKYKSGHATADLWRGIEMIANDCSTAARDFALSWSAGRPTLCFGTWRIQRPAATKMVLIWDKGGALGMGDLSIPWKPDHEEIYVLGSGFIGNRDSGSVLRCPPVQSMAKNGRLHPTEKPIDLMKRLIAKVPGTILDPFMGSGSTGAAAMQMGRPFVGIEVEQEWFDIACRRIEKAYKQSDMLVEAARAEQMNLGDF